MAGVSFIMHRGVKILYEDYDSNQRKYSSLLKMPNQ
jgi:hypothetical protein